MNLLRCLTGLSTAIGLTLATPAMADLYGYVDQQGIIHLANHKLDANYRLFKKGIMRPRPLPADPDALLPLVQTTEPGNPLRPTQSLATSAKAQRWSELISQTADSFQLDPHLLHSIISVESGYNPEALSPKGAVGLMQVMPATGQRFGISDLSDPRQNLIAGARYLRSLQAQFNGNLPLVIAAYNAGEGAVQKYRNTIPPYSETRDYVSKVLASYHKNKNSADNTGSLVRRSALSRPPVLILRGDQPATTESW